MAAKKKTHKLGDLQLRIMRVLWRKGKATVADVHKTLGTENLAYTTVATMLRKMEARDLVAHQTENRRFVYFPKVDEQDVVRNAAEDFVDRIFRGRITDAVMHLLDHREVSDEELARLEKLIARRRKGK
ncbi:CopY/TcrY family copper transport repressor [Thermostilla marina]